jgi:hypothetical protein
MDIQKALAGAKKAVETLYDKKATIKRQQAGTKSNGADGFAWTVIYDSVPGRLSTLGTQTLKNASLEEVNKVEYEVKFFLSSDYSVLVGDEFTIDGIRFETSKEPFKYVSHQEILLVRKGYA